MQKLKIGRILLPNNILLAPMAGVGCLPFRLIAKKHRAGLVCTGMINALGIVKRNRKTCELAEVAEKERPVAIQIYGSDPEVMACAAQIIEPDCDIIDINLGCSVPKIVKRNYGAALLKDTSKIKEILERVVNAVDCPVTAKIRSGWDEENINAIEVAKIIEDSGASALTIHPRTAKQAFEGKADWEVIALIKQTVSIPVIGNGDVTSPLDVKAMFESTGCDAVMIGRASQGNPWIFSRSTEFLSTGKLPPEPTERDSIQMLLHFTRKVIEMKGEYTGMKEIKKHVGWYVKRFPDATELRRQANQIDTYQELEEIFVNRFVQEGWVNHVNNFFNISVEKPPI